LTIAWYPLDISIFSRVASTPFFRGIFVIVLTDLLLSFILRLGRSQWPRSLRHVLFSTARTLGAQVRILLGAWMCVRVFCILLSCVGRGLASGWSPVQGVLPNVQIDS
jgi:hypothetical protein